MDSKSGPKAQDPSKQHEKKQRKMVEMSPQARVCYIISLKCI
jgi:hypothetical protein